MIELIEQYLFLVGLGISGLAVLFLVVVLILCIQSIGERK